MRSWVCKGLAQIQPWKPPQQSGKCQWWFRCPGSSGSGTNEIPRQVAIEEDANQQATAGASSDRKKLTGSQKRKQRRQALRANKATSGATAFQSPVASGVAAKRRKGSKDCYLESVLSPEQFELFREATLHAVDKELASNWPRFETSFCRGRVFIFVASNPEA